MAKAKTALVPIVPPPEPTEREKTAMARAKERVLARRKRPHLTVKGEGGSLHVGSPHADAIGHSYHMLDALGTCSYDFENQVLGQVFGTLCDRGQQYPSEQAANAALAIIAGAEPSNEIEALLASQMAATHGLAMLLLSRTRKTDDARVLEANGNLGVKLLRTFTMQAETLAKLRRGGGQTVRVEHVHVHAGGQAVVGNVAAGGGAQPKIEEQPHAKPVAALSHADAPFNPLRSTHAERDAVPVALHA